MRPMPGVRIQHPTERSCSFVLVDGDRPYKEPWTCPAPPAGCGSTHLFKTYHLRLDETGAAIVSRQIIERLKRIPLQPFAITNEVGKPPEQRIHVPTLRIRPRPIAPGGVG